MAKRLQIQPESTKPETQILFQGHNVLNIVSTGVMNEWAELNFLRFCHIEEEKIDDRCFTAGENHFAYKSYTLIKCFGACKHTSYPITLFNVNDSDQIWINIIRACAAFETPSAQISWIPVAWLFKCDQTPCKLHYCLLSPAVMIIFIAFKWKQWTNWTGDKCKHVPISHPPNRGRILGTRVSEADS